jgi:protein TonB
MSSSTHLSFASGTAPYPRVKPPWLRPVVTAVVIAVHAFVAWTMVVTSVQLFHAIDVTLVPSGDPLGLEEQEADDQPPPPEEVELPDLAMPAPLILSPDAPVKEEIVKPKTHVVEKRAAAERANSEQRPPGRRALGLPEGRAPARSRMDYAALLAIAIRRHTPTATSVGSGTARVQFHVNAYGAVVGISASGSNPAVAALARRIVASIHAPPPPGGSFYGVQNFVFH